MAVGTEILACFMGYIGLESCATPYTEEPDSSLYVSDLPGIDRGVIQDITTMEDETYAITWRKIQERAILSFRNSLLAKINQCFKINKLETIDCLACEYKELLALPLQYLLGNFTMIQALYNWNNSRFSTVNKQSVEEISAYYYTEFEKNLDSAVRSFDVLNSDCVIIEEQCSIKPNGRITTRESLM